MEIESHINQLHLRALYYQMLHESMPRILLSRGNDKKASMPQRKHACEIENDQ